MAAMSESVESEAQHRPWTFLTSHARVLLIISQNPDTRSRDIAALAGITERSTQRIVADLEAAGYLSHERIGRRNHYRVSRRAPLRHPHEQGVEIGALLELFTELGTGA
ncbi:helix-turn-helix transcriptional regulator [Ilumatobacter sp.]|uniref:helix-turn-helix transcriptional regulator n=1 Tax=Ilumatobacter sp. TaxID=1967498 RepID=UPI00345D572B